MPEQRTITVYKFDELSDKAKDKAREWYRECESQDFGAHGELYEPAETAAKLLGIEFATHNIPLMSGKTRSEPKIYWELHVQGSGASFEGSYRYNLDCKRKVRSEFPTDTKLHAIADGLVEIQKKHGFTLTAKITQSGRGVHEYTMDAEVYEDDGNLTDPETSTAVLELMRDFAKWIYKYIDAEYEYRMSDEAVDESIQANDYAFTIEGRRTTVL
jgi:hypothetical protein